MIDFILSESPLASSGGAEWSLFSTAPNPLMTGKATIATVTGSGGATAYHTKVSQLVPWDARALRLVYANWDQHEQSVGNSIVVKAWVINWEGTKHPVTFNGGQESVTIADLAYVFSDPVHVGSIYRENPNTGRPNIYWVVTEVSVADAAHFVPRGFRLLSDSNTDNYTTLAEGHAAGTWDGVAEIPKTSLLGAYSPFAIQAISRDGTRQPSLANVGDSIQSGTGDSGYRQGLGSVTIRLANNQPGRKFDATKFPDYGCVSVAKGGELVADEANPLLFNKRFDMACLATTIVANGCTNDSETKTVAETKANILSLVKRFTDAGKRVVYLAKTPRTSTTDAWTTGANQTVPSDLVAGGIQRGVWNQTIRTWIADGSLVTEAIANGSPASRVKVANAQAVVSGTNLGAQSALGEYWLPPTNAAFATGSITSTNQLSSSGFRDSTLTAYTTNQWRGYNVRVTATYKEPPAPGAVVDHRNENLCIRSNLSSNGQVLTGVTSDLKLIGVPAAYAPDGTWDPAWNPTATTYSINDCNCGDGVHPTSSGYALMTAEMQALNTAESLVV